MIDKIMKLKALLETPEYTALTADQQLAEVNAKDKSFNRTLNSRVLLRWSGADGRAARLKRAAEDNTLPEAVQAAAYSAFKLLDRADAQLDLDDQEVILLLDGLVQSAVLTEADKASLQALSATIGSEAEKQGIVPEGGEVYLGHINQARSLIGG